MDLLSACPNHMNPPLSYLDPSQVGSLKVYAGLAPVSVGGDSIGGAIVAETAAPVFATPGQGSLVKGEASAFYRSNGHAKGANLSATYATESFSISYTGATAQSGNYDAGGNFKERIFGAGNNPYYTGRPGHTLSRDEVGSTAYETRNHTLGVALRGGSHLVEAKLGFQDMPEQLWPNQRMDMLANDQKRLNLRYLGQFDWGALEARAYHEDVDHFMDFGADKKFWYRAGTPDWSGAPCGGPSATCATGMPMYTASKNTGATLKADIHLTRQDLLRVGGELQRYRLDDWWPPVNIGFPGSMCCDEFWNIRDGRRDRLGLFAEWEARWSPQWLSLLGVRGDRVIADAADVHGYNTTLLFNPYRTDANNFNALDHRKRTRHLDLTALLRHTPTSRTEYEAGFARKTRSPNLYERYPWSRFTMAAAMNNFVGDGNAYFGTDEADAHQARPGGQGHHLATRS
jgi:iron complex outermembrane receptor protein